MAGARQVREVWVSADQDDAAILEDIRELAEDKRVPVREVAKSKFFAQARCEAPQGVIALAAPLPEFDLDDLLAVRPMPGSGKGRQRSKNATPFVVALDGVTDPGNLGAVLRSAECAGATGVLLPKHRAVHVTPAAAKTAAGAVEHLPVALAGGLPNALSQLRDAGVWIVGLDGDAEQPLHELPTFTGGVCLVLGAEGRGLSRLVRQRCDVAVRIPLYGELPSLNVSAAAALACFELARRRT
jgi:23S rRNA (guanosine2251-2'-O)-methyltransferase